MKKLLISVLALFMMFNIAYAQKNLKGAPQSLDMDTLFKNTSIQIKEDKLNNNKLKGGKSWSVTVENISPLLLLREIDYPRGFVVKRVGGIAKFQNILETDKLDGYICPQSPSGTGPNNEPEAFWASIAIDLNHPDMYPCGEGCKQTDIEWEGNASKTLLHPGDIYNPTPETEERKPAGTYPVKLRFERGAESSLTHVTNFKIIDINPVPGTDSTIFTTHNGNLVKIAPANGVFQNQYPSQDDPSQIKVQLNEGVTHASAFVTKKGQPLSTAFIGLNIPENPDPNNPNELTIEDLKAGKLLNFPYRFGNDMQRSFLPGFHDNTQCFPMGGGKGKSKASPRKGAAAKKGNNQKNNCPGEYVLHPGEYDLTAVYILNNKAYTKQISFKVEYFIPAGDALFHWETSAPYVVTIDPEKGVFENITPLKLHIKHDNPLGFGLLVSRDTYPNEPYSFFINFATDGSNIAPMKYSFTEEDMAISGSWGGMHNTTKLYNTPQGERHFLVPHKYRVRMYCKVSDTFWEPCVGGESTEKELKFEVKYLTPVGVKENQQADKVSVYPNPVKDTLNIETPFNQGTITITDMRGAVVYGPVALQPSINLSRLSAGQYIVIINSGNNKVSKQITKN